MTTKQSYTLMVLLYTLAFGILLLNVDGQYWDDWVLDQPKEILLNIYDQSAHIGLGYITWALSAIGNGLWVFRILVFFEVLFSGIFVFKVLKRSRFLNEEQSFIVALVFLTYPIFMTRAVFVNYLYPTCLFLFWLAFNLISKGKASILVRLLGLGLFAVSFIIQSFFLMYVLVPIFLFLQMEQISFKQRMLSFVRKYADFILLPLLVKAFIDVFLVPHGLYSNYNQISAEKILSAFQDFWRPVFETLFSPFAILEVRDVVIGMAFGIVIYGFLSLRRKSFLTSYTIKQSLFFLLFGVLATFLAVFPYLAVGKMPASLGYESRHQLNLGLGLGFLGLSCLRVVPGATCGKILNFRLAVLSFFIAFCVLTSMRMQQGFLERNLIKDAILLTFQRQESDFAKSLYITTDNTENRRFGMFWEFYEVSGMWKKATGKTDKLFIFPEQNTASNLQIISSLKKYPQYNFTDWDEVREMGVLEIFQNVRLGLKDVIVTYLLKFRNEDGYKGELLKLYTVRIHN